MLECMDKNVSKKARDRNPWYLEVKVLWEKSRSAANNPDREHYISHCIKCEFKSLIGNKRITSSLHVPCGAKISTSNTLLAMSVNDSNLQTSDCVNHHRKDDLLAIRKSYLGAVQPDHDCLLFLQDYFGTSPFHTIPYDRAKLISEFNDSQTKRSNHHSKHVGLNNVCSGAVIVPDSKIIIQSQACNNGLKADHRGFAVSKSEPSPGAMHGVVSQLKSVELHKFMERNKMKMKPIPREWIHRFKLNDVPSPEDSSKRRMFHLEVITIPQAQPTTTPKVTGKIDFNVEELASYYFYGHQTTRGHIDCTIIISSLSETEDTSQARPKLLLLRFHRLIKSSVSDNDVLRLHAIIGAVSGKHGFEMTRLGGSSGRTSDQSDRDFLHAMHEVNAALPVRCGACKITRDELWYNVVYRKVNPKTDKSVIGHAKYSPAQRGGSFDM